MKKLMINSIKMKGSYNLFSFSSYMKEQIEFHEQKQLKGMCQK